MHGGIDIAEPANSNIYAAADGIVGDVETSCPNYYSRNCGGGFGNLVALRHPNNNNVYILYAHNQRPLVTINQAVKCGQLIVIQVTTGSSKGDHSHFQVGTSGAYTGTISPKSIGVPNIKS